jgi:hypothetical protein
VRLQGCRTVEGLTVSNASCGITSYGALATLEHVTAGESFGLDFVGNALCAFEPTTISLPVLIDAPLLVVEQGNVSVIEAPRFEAGGVLVRNLQGLSELILPALAFGVLELDNVTALESVSAPQFVSGGFNISNAPQLRTLEFPLLRGNRGAEIIFQQFGLGVEVLDLPLFDADAFALIDSPNLVSLSLPSFTGDLIIENAPLLQTVTLTTCPETFSGDSEVVNDALQALGCF